MTRGSKRANRSSTSPFTRFSTIAFLATVVVFVIVSSLSPGLAYLNWASALSITTLLLYGYDKFRATRHGLRVPELVLHLMAVMGGFAGGWLGMFLFRHKVRKPAFWAVLAVSTLLHVAIVRFYPRILG